MPTRVYEYGLLEPVENADLVRSQMRQAHVYRNVLVEIERQRRAAIRAAMASHPDVAQYEADLVELGRQRDEAREVILTARRAARRRAETPEQRDRVKTLNDQVRATRKLIKDLRAQVAADQEVRAKIAEADAFARERLRQERSRCGVYWGTYLLQEADADAARMSKTPPKFQRWRGEGRVSVQIQRGISVAALFEDDSRVHVDRVSPDAHDPLARRGTRRRECRTVLRLRVQSDHARPIWAVWPMLYHRPIPEGATIKVVTVSCRRQDCRRWAWRVHFTVDIPASAARPAPADGVLGLNLGFCMRPDGGLRAGYLVGSDGYEREILLPADRPDTHRGGIASAIAKADSLRSIRDKHLDAFRAHLVAWRQEVWNQATHDRLVEEILVQGARFPDGWSRLAEYIRLAPLPAWFVARTSHVHVWRSAERFRSLAFEWRRRRFPGDDLMYNAIDGHGTPLAQVSWRYRDEHLERYESGTRRHALLRRREHYRILAAEMARRYRTLVIDDTDLREFQKSPAPESERVEFGTIKHNQRLAAPSELRRVLLNAFGPERTIKVSAANLTRKCHACGILNDWDRAAAGRMHTCSGCGKTWDQDANACQNLVTERLRAVAAGETVALEDKRPSRSQRLLASKAAKAQAGLARQ